MLIHSSNDLMNTRTEAPNVTKAQNPDVTSFCKRNFGAISCQDKVLGGPLF